MSLPRDPFAAPLQAFPDPDALETEYAWSHAKYRCTLGAYINLMRTEEPDPGEPQEVEVPTNPDGPNTWAEQEQRSIEEHAA